MTGRERIIIVIVVVGGVPGVIMVIMFTGCSSQSLFNATKWKAPYRSRKVNSNCALL
jgi:hypothetical protein